jgi:hypothetical protein
VLQQVGHQSLALHQLPQQPQQQLGHRQQLHLQYRPQFLRQQQPQQPHPRS